jgi:hypothetical protein
MMTTFPLTQCATMLAIDPKTLRQWLRQANLPLHVHPTDARLKCLSWEHVQPLATLHDRPLPSPGSAPPAPPVAATQLQPKRPTPVEPVCDAAQVQTVSTSSPSLPAAAELIEKLAQLETPVSTMQQHLTHLALELLHERELRYERRLETLEALVHQTAAQAASPPQAQTRGEETRQEQGARNARRLHPAELPARSRVLPLIEYGADGSYVVICPHEGALPLVPESPEWFDWLATLSSFCFVGKQGRFTAYRYIHQRTYKQYLGVTDRLTIDCLEQGAASLQSHLAAL